LSCQQFWIKFGVTTPSTEVDAMNLKLSLLWAALILAAPCFSQMSEEVLQAFDHSLTARASCTSIPFKLYRGYLVVAQGSLGTLSRLNFLIDTGANPSAVDRRVARKLGLTGKAGRLVLYQQNVHSESVVLSNVRVGPIRAESVPGLIQDLSPVERILGVRIDAVIGLSVLQLSTFIIDYDAKRIIFGPVETWGLAVPFETGPPTLTVRGQIQDQSVRLLVDTGATDLLLFDCQLRDRLRQLPLRGVKPFLNSADTVFETKEVRLSALRLGPDDFGVTKAFLVNDRAMCGLPFDGVVGVRSLGLKWIAFDFEHGNFSWKR
jgi:predicted aspartyl protease